MLRLFVIVVFVIVCLFDLRSPRVYPRSDGVGGYLSANLQGRALRWRAMPLAVPPRHQPPLACIVDVTRSVTATCACNNIQERLADAGLCTEKFGT